MASLSRTAPTTATVCFYSSRLYESAISRRPRPGRIWERNADMYCQVVFAQDYETLDEAEDLLFAGGFPSVENIRNTVAFLSQWDYGVENEYPDALSDEIERYRGDDVYEEGKYILVSRRGLYISLWREAGN